LTESRVDRLVLKPEQMPRKARKRRELDAETLVFLQRLGQQIRERRSENYSQEDFAAEVDVFRSHMSLVEQGKTDLRLSTLIRIARAFGITPAELLSFADGIGS
jgi:DNA-binding XRE family transcriptional regulator